MSNLTIILIASETIKQHHFVKINVTDTTKIDMCDADEDYLIGIAASSADGNDYEAGDEVAVIIAGFAKLKSSVALPNAGLFMSTKSDGTGKLALTANPSGSIVIGFQALETGAIGDIVTGRFLGINTLSENAAG